VDWLQCNNFSELDPSPLVLEKYVFNNDPSPMLQPLETQKQKQDWKKQYTNPKFKAALSEVIKLLASVRCIGEIVGQDAT